MELSSTHDTQPSRKKKREKTDTNKYREQKKKNKNKQRKHLKQVSNVRSAACQRFWDEFVVCRGSNEYIF